MRADLTIVIPVYDRQDELCRCLDSILAQTLRPDRVIVVDDGSHDNSVDVARQHPLAPLVITADHGGAAAARNIGLSEVTTGWTMFFDSDDIMSPEHLAKAMENIDDRTDIVGWNVSYRTLTGSRHILRFETDDIRWHNIMHGTMSTQRYMARTELFRKAGGWSPEVRYWDDIELGSRLLALNPNVKKIEAVNVTVIQSAKSISGTVWSDNPKKYQSFFDAAKSKDNAIPSDWIALKKAILAADIFRENPAEGRRMFDSIELKTFPVRLAYYYRRTGMRGIARFLRPFFSKSEGRGEK